MGLPSFDRQALIASTVFACVLLAAPASATADECEVPTWDAASKTVTHHIRKTDAYPSISPYFREGAFYACWKSFPDAENVVIDTDRALDITLGTATVQSLLRQGGSEIKLAIKLTTPNYSPRISLQLSDWPSATPLPVRLGRDGLDLNGDGDVDVTLQLPAVKSLTVSPPLTGEAISLDARQSLISYWAINVVAEPKSPGRSIFVASPRGQVSASGGDGADTIRLIGAVGYGIGHGGDDVIDARSVDQGGSFRGDGGNDRMFLGPGIDVINERGQSYGDDYYNTGAGDDRVWSFAGSDQIITGAGNDQVVTIAQKGERMAVNTGVGNDKFYDDSTRHPGLTVANLGPGNDRSRIFGQLPKYWLATHVNCGPGRDHYQAWGRNKWMRGCETFIT